MRVSSELTRVSSELTGIQFKCTVKVFTELSFWNSTEDRVLYGSGFLSAEFREIPWKKFSVFPSYMQSRIYKPGNDSNTRTAASGEL
jgi:hypothetical protein